MSLRVIKITVIVCALSMLAACGQKGELYLPDKKTTSLVSSLYLV